MITAVWLDKIDSELSDKNGVYLLFDPNVTSTRGAKSIPDVTNPDNWRKISGEVDLSAIQDILDDHESRLDALEADSTHSYGYRKDFPEIGQQNHLYIANDEHRTYVFVGGNYLPIADQFDYEDNDNNPDTPAVRIIYGGSAD
jgi:hypothetical protein